VKRTLAIVCAAAAISAAAFAATDPAITTVYRTDRPVGLMVTSGGWAYCEQMRPIAQRTGYTLICGTYVKDEYLGPGLRSRRHLDWGEPGYLASFAAKIEALRRKVGGKLVLVGVSYSGFGVATLASHHPELRPDRLIVIDSYLDLPARRGKLPPSHETAREIDAETGGSQAELRRRSVSASALARLVRGGTKLTMVWSVSEDEREFFRGATCDRTASAATLAQLASTLGRPVPAWITRNRHGVDLWRHGVAILEGRNPGRKVLFTPDGEIPAGATCE
jgi:pimeloyl-ACP methyl ester carboxylesterase